jgi:octaprenyl-diphosphate synthase
MVAGSDAQRSMLRKAIGEGGRERIDDVVAAIVDTDALKYTTELARRHAQAARDALNGLPESDAKHAMLATAEFAVARTY